LWEYELAADAFKARDGSDADLQVRHWQEKDQGVSSDACRYSKDQLISSILYHIVFLNLTKVNYF
jgi:hypothetical protein